MRHILVRRLTLGLCLVLACLVRADRDKEENPLANLSRKQRQHFEVYVKVNQDILEKKELDREKIFKDTFEPIRDWCEEAAPKFKYESMKAGDKAKTITNERKKREWIAKSALYKDMQNHCVSIMEQYKSGRSSKIRKEMNKFIACEVQAKQQRFPLPRRDWMTPAEAEALLWKVTAPKREKYQREQREKRDQELQRNQDQDDQTSSRRDSRQLRRNRQQRQGSHQQRRFRQSRQSRQY